MNNNSNNDNNDIVFLKRLFFLSMVLLMILSQYICGVFLWIYTFYIKIGKKIPLFIPTLYLFRFAEVF